VGHGAEPSLLHGQAGLGAVERLDLMGWMAPYRLACGKRGGGYRS
jgi:hypothetical protein